MHCTKATVAEQTICRLGIFCVIFIWCTPPAPLYTKITWRMPGFTFVNVRNAEELAEMGYRPHICSINNTRRPTEYRGARLFRGVLLINATWY